MDMIEVVARAMQECVIRDDEGEFPRLFDMLDFSGENKARTVVNALAIAALKAMQEPTEEMLDASWNMTGDSKEMRPRTHAHYSRHYTAMIDAALKEEG